MPHKQMEEIVTWYQSTHLCVQWFVAFLFFNWAATFFFDSQRKTKASSKKWKKSNKPLTTQMCWPCLLSTTQKWKKKLPSAEWKNCFALYFKFPTFQRVQTVNLATKTKKQVNVVFTLLFVFFGLTKSKIKLLFENRNKTFCYLRTWYQVTISSACAALSNLVFLFWNFI